MERGTGTKGDDASAEEFLTALRPHLNRLGGLIDMKAPPWMREDVTQDTLLRALGSWHSFDRGRPMWPWLARIAQRACASAWEREARWRQQAATNEAVAPLSESAPGSDQHLAAFHARAAVAAALAGLGHRDRVLLFRCDVEETPAHLVARAMTMTPGAVRVALHRARYRFRDLAARRWDDAGVAVAFVVGQLRLRPRPRHVPLSPAGGFAFSASVLATLVATLVPHSASRQEMHANRGHASAEAVEARLPTNDNEATSISVSNARSATASAFQPQGTAGRAGPPLSWPTTVVTPVADASVGPQGIYGGARVEFTTPDGPGHASANPQVRCRHSTVTKTACTVIGTLPSSGPVSFYGLGDGDP